MLEHRWNLLKHEIFKAGFTLILQLQISVTRSVKLSS